MNTHIFVGLLLAEVGFMGGVIIGELVDQRKAVKEAADMAEAEENIAAWHAAETTREWARDLQLAKEAVAS